MRNRGVLVKLVLLVAIPVLAIGGMGVFGIWNAKSTFEYVKQVHGTAVDFRQKPPWISAIRSINCDSSR